VFTGIARSLASNTLKNDTKNPVVWQPSILLSAIALALTALALICRDDETTNEFLRALNLRYLPILTVNLLATAVALTFGYSVLVPIRYGMGDFEGDYGSRNRNDVLTLLMLTSTTGLMSTLALRRSYTSWPQCLFYTVIIALQLRTEPGLRHGPQWWTSDNPSDVVALTSVDSESFMMPERSEDLNRIRIQDIRIGRDLFCLRLLMFVVVLPLMWLAYLTFNFSDQIHQTTIITEPRLDLEYSPQFDSEIVISMYKERVDEVAHLISTMRAVSTLRHPRIHIYIKDEKAKLELVKQGTRADQVTLLRNVGREAETYLHHILYHWDSLAKHTLFLQANVHNPREFFPRVHDYFHPEYTGMLSLGWSGQVCNCEDCEDRFNFRDTTHLFPDISKRIDNSTVCDKVLLTYKGQFIVSAKRIRGINRSIYEDLHQAFVDRNSWAHQEAYLQGRPDSMSAPVFGYTMERMWNLLFQCNSIEVAWKCPSLLSGNRIGGSIEDCQCLDPMP